MLELPFYKKYDKPLCLALGFFDCLHLGHRTILEKCITKSKYNKCDSAVITFKNNPNKNLNKQIDLVYTYQERLILLKDIEIDIVISCNFDDDFMVKSAEDFLKELTYLYNIKYIVCGNDYNFGYKGIGDKNLLREYCNNNSIEFETVEDVIVNDKKVSSTLIRNLLFEGFVEDANYLLNKNYFISGAVVAGNKIGRKLLFPTINLHLHNQKLKIKQGVYLTKTLVKEKSYYSITNCGGRPTFNSAFYKVETHILDFNEDIYGEEVIIEFISKIRDTKTFTDVDDLKKQISIDVSFVKNLINTL